MSATEPLRWALLWGLPTLIVAGAATWLLNAPALRMERARLFLSCLSLGLRRGQSPERTIVDFSNSRDPSLGARFHLLAAWIQSGLNFSEALQRLPGLLPARVNAMLMAGAEAGVLPGALAAARRGAGPIDPQKRAALSCQILMLFILNPLILAVLPFFLMKVFPAMNAILTGFGKPMPPGMAFLIEWSRAIFALQFFSIAFLYLGTIFYVGGNRFTRWMEAGLFPVSHWLALRIPWKRKRLLRDFAAMFALLLDAGLPEKVALRLAGGAVSNDIFAGRVEKALTALEQGTILPRALELLDPPREFAWRLANALQRKGDFSGSLAGWFEVLEAKADAEEQAAGDLLSTSLLLMNGLIVALIIGTVMQCVFSFSMMSVQ